MEAEIRRATINGLPGLVRFRDDHAQAGLAFGVAGGRIAAAFVISNPEKLRHLAALKAKREAAYGMAVRPSM